MFWKRRIVVTMIGMSFGSGLSAHASDLKITLPKRSFISPSCSV